MIFFKFGAWLHYTLLAPLGERLMPLWMIGWVMSIASIIQLLLDVPAGKILDRYGYKKMLVIGSLFFVGAVALLFTTISSVTLIISILCATIGRLFFWPWVNAYILSQASSKNSSVFMAYRDISGSIGIVLAALSVPFVLKLSDIMLVLVLFVLLMLALWAIVLSPSDKKHLPVQDHPHERTHHQRHHSIRRFWYAIQKLNPASVLLILTNFSGAVFYGVVWFVVPLIIVSLPEADGRLLGVWLGMFDFAVIITGGILATFVDTMNKKVLIFLGLLLFAVAGTLLWFHFGLLFLVFAFLATMGDELASLPLWTRLHRLDTEHNNDGLISGVINLFEDLGWAIGPFVAGLLYSLLGAQITLLIGALPLVIIFFLYYFVVHKHTLHFPLLEGPRKAHKMRHKR